jgi:hypothetical protein
MKPVLPPFQRGEGFGTLGSSFVEPGLPPAIALTPATWGAWLSLVLLALGAVWLAARLVRRQRSTRHRRVARRELGALRVAWQRASADERARTLERLPLLLKGCALGSFERSRVAKLAGDAWLAFLRSTAPGAGFEGPAGDALVTLCERGAAAVTESSVPALFSATDRWLARHHV